jgi:hypothetical protein
MTNTYTHIFTQTNLQQSSINLPVQLFVLSFCTSHAQPVDDSNIKHVQAMIVGPPETPYEFGFFNFDGIKLEREREEILLVVHLRLFLLSLFFF